MNGFLTDDWVRLNPTPDSEGYLHVYLYINGSSCNRTIHQLVSEAVWGPCPPGMEACHNDGNPANNYWWNLRYDTHQGNMADRRIHGTDCSGEKHWNAQRTWEEVQEIRAKYATGKYTIKSLALECGLSPGMIYPILRNRIWVEDGFVAINEQTEAHKRPHNKPWISRDDPVVARIKDLHESGFSYRKIAKQVGYSHMTCYKIVSGTYPFQPTK